MKRFRFTALILSTVLLVSSSGLTAFANKTNSNKTTPRPPTLQDRTKSVSAAQTTNSSAQPKPSKDASKGNLPNPESFGNDPEAIAKEEISDSKVLDQNTGDLKEEDELTNDPNGVQPNNSELSDIQITPTELIVIDSLDQDYYNPAPTPEAPPKKNEPIQLGRGISKYSDSSANRKYNIKKAAGVLNGRVIKPGEVFDFNRVIGPADKSSGYRNAKVILDGDFVDGYGGGICQVSSTLFNAALQSGIDVPDRRNHSLKISYLPAGYDAAVSYGHLNLKLKNTYKVPVKIKATANNSTITIDLVAMQETPKRVVSLTRTKNGNNSYLLSRTVKENNKIIKKDSFRSIYRERLQQ
ncbi:MAG: VanW family protein [Filifactor alocis]|nr:VanW family protein [Filifactor alocis]